MVVPTRLITARVDAPQIVEVPANSRCLAIDVRTELANESEHDVVLHAPDADQEIFWHVLDENHREVLRERSRKAGDGGQEGVETFRSRTIASGHSDHETATLQLDVKKLKHGHTYTVRAEVFGQIAEAEFVAVVHRPERSPRTASKRAPKSKL